MISPSTQSLNIVLVNLTPDSKPYGLLGYFFGANNFLKTSSPNSNESLVVFLDTETIYVHKDLADKEQGIVDSLLALSHEFVHMINFYERTVSKEPDANGTFYSFDT